MRKSGLVLVGIVLVVVGCVFTLQGLGYLAGSVMTGVTVWAIIGPVLAIAGLALVIRAVRIDRNRS